MTLSPALIGRLLAGASVGAAPSTIAVRAPFTGEVLVDLPVSGPAEVVAEAARLRAEVKPMPGYTVDDCLEAIAAFRLTDPTLPARGETYDGAGHLVSRHGVVP